MNRLTPEREAQLRKQARVTYQPSMASALLEVFAGLDAVRAGRLALFTSCRNAAQLLAAGSAELALQCLDDGLRDAT